jgi:hypothetical protein
MDDSNLDAATLLVSFVKNGAAGNKKFQVNKEKDHRPQFFPPFFFFCSLEKSFAAADRAEGAGRRMEGERH